MKKKLEQLYQSSALATKIRYSYIILIIPIIVFLIFCFYNLYASNRRYEDMINSVVSASQFNLDFKKDFDYETYLLIVGNKTLEESNLKDMIREASDIVVDLEKLTDSPRNSNYLASVKKYLTNLENYSVRIEENLIEGNKYEENIEIWENDIQIVTSLVQETIFQYIYYELRDIQASRTEYQAFFMQMLKFSGIAFAGILLMLIFLSYFIPLSIIRPIKRLGEVTDQVAKGNLAIRSDVKTGAEVGMLSESLNSMIDKINELLEQVKVEQIQLRKAEFELLQSQINPHFLYNTLDAIIWLAEAGEQKKVVNMVGSLSEFFRASLNQGKDIISLKEELNHVRSYLEIQQVRYQDILQYEINIPRELEQCLIPKITIQPLVENALYHGIKNKRGQGKIIISGSKNSEGTVIQVFDNGIGIKEERLNEVIRGITNKTPTENGIYGLYNVNERIRLNFGEKYGISIESNYGEGTKAKILLPCIEN